MTCLIKNKYQVDVAYETPVSLLDFFKLSNGVHGNFPSTVVEFFRDEVVQFHACSVFFLFISAFSCLALLFIIIERLIH